MNLQAGLEAREVGMQQGSARPVQTADAAQRPARAATRLAPAQWAELAPGEAVWVERAGYGFDAGYVDDVSQNQEIIWVEFAGLGRRLLCSGDPLHVWTGNPTED
jgi:hypothetical protein